MRIAEVAVVSSPGTEKEIFIQAICQKLEKANEKICFGRLEINSDLVLHLYGVSVDKDEETLSWDLLSNKVLGYVFIFNWNDQNSLEAIKNVLDHFAATFSAPILVVANINDKSNIPLPEKFNDPGGLSIDRNIRFHFCQISDPVSAKKIIANIIDILLENLP